VPLSGRTGRGGRVGGSGPFPWLSKGGPDATAERTTHALWCAKVQAPLIKEKEERKKDRSKGQFRISIRVLANLM